MVIGFDASRSLVPDRTGTETYSYKLLEALITTGGNNEFFVYTRGSATFKGDFFKGQKKVRVREIGWPRLWTQGGLALRTYLDNLDVLFIPAHTLPVLRKPGLKTVVTIHGLEYEYLPEYYRFPQKLYLTWSTRYAVRYASRIIAVSQFTADELARRLGADKSKIRVVREGVDTEVYSRSYSDKEKQSVLRELGVTKPFILFVGVVQPRKNLERLIEAFSSLTGTVLVNHNLVIAGKLGWMYGKILKAPKKFGVEDRVKFVGFVDREKLPILYQEAVIYVQPSLTEGFGLPVLEAMAAGTPVVAARAGALPEVVGQAGVLVNPLSVEDIAQGIEEVVTKKGLRKSLSERGLLWCRRFSWKRAAHETLALLGEMVGRTD